MPLAAVAPPGPCADRAKLRVGRRDEDTLAMDIAPANKRDRSGLAP